MKSVFPLVAFEVLAFGSCVVAGGGGGFPFKFVASVATPGFGEDLELGDVLGLGVVMDLGLVGGWDFGVALDLGVVDLEFGLELVFVVDFDTNLLPTFFVAVILDFAVVALTFCEIFEAD